MAEFIDFEAVTETETETVTVEEKENDEENKVSDIDFSMMILNKKMMT